MIKVLTDAMDLSSWQPIATAPKDGTPVLLFDNGLVGLFYWGVDENLRTNVHGAPMPPTWVGVIIQSELNGSDVKEKLIGLVGSDASHWMPLPPAPTLPIDGVVA